MSLQVHSLDAFLMFIIPEYVVLMSTCDLLGQCHPSRAGCSLPRATVICSVPFLQLKLDPVLHSLLGFVRSLLFTAGCVTGFMHQS